MSNTTLPAGVHTYSRRVERMAELVARGEARAADLARVVREDAAEISAAILQRINRERRP